MADKEPDDLKGGPSDDLLDPAKKKPRYVAGLSEGPKGQDTQHVEKLQDVGVPPMPDSLPKLWYKTCDMSSDEEVSQIVTFLRECFTFHRGSISRTRIYDRALSNEIEYEYHYSKDYLNWLLCPPNFQKEWHRVVLRMPEKQIVAFIAAVPKTMKIADAYLSDESDENGEGEDSGKSDETDMSDDDVLMAEIKLLCIIPTDVSLDIEPRMLIDMSQSAESHGAKSLVYASVNSFSTHRVMEFCKCWSRPLNIKKLSDLNFFKLKEGETAEESQAAHDDVLTFVDMVPVVREMELKDVGSVTTLLGTYLEERLDHVPRFSEDEIRHWFLPREGIVESYVAESDSKGITHFISFSLLSFSATIENDDGCTWTTTELKAARLLYNASTETEPHELLKKAVELAQAKDADIFDFPNIMGIEDARLRCLRFRPSVQHYFARVPKTVNSGYVQQGLVLY